MVVSVYRETDSNPGPVSGSTRQVQLLTEPDRQRLAEAREPRRRIAHIGLHQSLEFRQRLLIEGDVVKLLGTVARLSQAVLHRLPRKARVALLPAEPLLLDGCDDLAVTNQRSGRIMVESTDAQNRRHSDDLTRFLDVATIDPYASAVWIVSSLDPWLFLEFMFSLMISIIEIPNKNI